MEEKYKIFSEEFNNVLELIDDYSNGFMDSYKAFADILPKNIKNALKDETEKVACNDKYSLDYMRIDDVMYFNYIRKKPYVYGDLFLKEINTQDVALQNLFVLTVRNTPTIQQPLHIDVVEKNGKYDIVKSNFNPDALDVEYSVDLFFTDEGYYLQFKITKNSVNVLNKITAISFDELTRYLPNNDLDDNY